MESLPNATLRQSAWGKAWYVNAESIQLSDKTYVKYGLPRVLRPGDVDYALDYMGVAVALDRLSVNHEIVYLLTNADECEFQPYQIEPEKKPEESSD